MTALRIAFAVLLAATTSASAWAGECNKTLESALQEVERSPSVERVRPVLLGLSRCGMLGRLAAAAKAATEKKAQRSEILASPAAEDLGFDCKPLNPAAPASFVAKHCPAPADLALSPAALADLDAGTYVYALATYRAFVREGPVPMSAKRLLSNLLLAAALEGGEKRERLKHR